MSGISALLYPIRDTNYTDKQPFYSLDSYIDFKNQEKSRNQFNDLLMGSILSSEQYSLRHICLSGQRFRMRLLVIFAVCSIFTFVLAKSIKDRSRCLPFPIPLITPPVTTIYFFSFLITSASCTLANKRRGLLTHGNLFTNPDIPFKKRIANAVKHTFIDDWFVMLLLAINVTNTTDHSSSDDNITSAGYREA